MKPKGFWDARKGRRREPSLRKGDASAAPTRLRLATGLAAAEEEGLLAMYPTLLLEWLAGHRSASRR